MNLQSQLERLKTAGAALSRAQLVSLAAVFIAVVGLVVGSAYYLNVTPYGILFSDMDAESANSVVTRLKNSKVPYTLDDGGRTIRVPVAKLDELRLQVAGEGLPASGRIGFEIFDRTSFGVTDFLEHVNYRRALEGELARTIATIAEVASARVHIAMARPSLFASQDQAATASVVLKLRGNRPLSSTTTAAITGLVAAGVEGLRPEAVVIIDNFGRPLTKSADGRDESMGTLQAERQLRIERELSTQVVALLEPVVGPNHVRVNVSAKLNADTSEETIERFDPASVVRSHQSLVQTGAGAGVGGLAGTRSNAPPPATAKGGLTPQPPNAVVAASAGPGSASETTNYEIGKVTTHRVSPQGQIARLSVAVLLDDDRSGGQAGKSKPRSAKDLEKIHEIVASAVGYDEERGDRLTVENIAFEEPAPEERPLPWYRHYSPWMLDVARVAALILVVLLAVFGVIRPTVRRTLGPAISEEKAALTEGEGLTVADVEGALEANAAEEAVALAEPSEDELDGPGDQRLPTLTRKLSRQTQSEPENAARLIREWLAEETR